MKKISSWDILRKLGFWQIKPELEGDYYFTLWGKSCLFFIILALVALIFLIVHCGSLASGQASLKWPSVKGKISYFSNADINESVVVRSPIGFYSNEALCIPKIIYKYDINGKTYSNDRVAFFPVGRIESDCEREANDFIKKKEVAVYYDPEHLGSAVLWPGVRAENYTTILICFILFLFVILLWVATSVMVPQWKNDKK